MDFDMPKNQNSYYKVIGLGGGGGNAVNNLYKEGVNGVNFYLCNTDEQAMALSNIPNKILLGKDTLQGLGAGANAETGKAAANESLDEINDMLMRNTKMVFLVAGLGKGTGTGSIPVFAKAAKDKGILTVAIVTTPFHFESNKKTEFIKQCLTDLKEQVDSLIIIENERLREVYNDLTFVNAFAKVDNVVGNAVRAISEIVTVPGYMNVDFNDVKTIMKDSGVALMASGKASGDNRAIVALDNALNSPLLRNKDIYGAKNILLNISSSSLENQLTIDEIGIITDSLTEKTGGEAFVIWGNTFNDNLGDELSITLLATGFKNIDDIDYTLSKNVIKQTTVAEKTEVDSFINLGTTDPDANLFSVSFDDNEEIHCNTEDAITVELHLPPQALSRNENEAIEEENLSNNNNEESEFSLKNRSEFVSQVQSGFFNTPKSFATQADNKKILDEERKRRIKMLSNKYNNPKLLNDLEKEPAVMRNNTELDDIVFSNETVYGEHSLANDEQAILKKNNGYLHEKPD